MFQHHILIGPPSSGKSTLAKTLQQFLASTEIISTDQIRKDLYGDPNIQGYWPDIFTQVQNQCHQAITTGKTLIYDATNAKRPWRFNFLRPFLDAFPEHSWIGWHLQTPLSTCLIWNRQRKRQVPDDVIQSLHQALQTFPPEPAEGMAIVQAIDPSQDFDLDQYLTTSLPKLQRQITNRQNATQHPKRSFHPYSDLLEFERLLYLLQLLLEQPGAGTFHDSQPEHLQTLLGKPINLNAIGNDLDELSLLLSQKAPIYGDRSALIRNLDWLHCNGFLSPQPSLLTWELPEESPPLASTHAYSDSDRFLRLMGILRFILHHPFYEEEGSALEALTQGLRSQNILCGSLSSCRDTLRKDIQLILKPYGLLQPHRYRQGYFLGTGIFSYSQLLQLHQILAGQAKSLADPTMLDLLNSLSERLKYSKLSDLEPYPVRALYNFTIVNQSYLPNEALANTVSQLEQEIEQGQCLELQRFPAVGRHGTESESFFQVWPIQIVFHNIGWYLGYELVGGPQQGLLQFERLDRLFRGRMMGQKRDRKLQEQAGHQLQRLFQTSGGLFLGTNPRHQQQWLKGNSTQRQEMSAMLELWCNDRSFRFISEGDQRFPIDQMKFSPRLPNSHRPGNPKLFRLKPTGDSHHPHRLQITLPYWALQGIELQRWIWGFKQQVRVISPPELVEQFRAEVRALDALYNYEQM